MAEMAIINWLIEAKRWAKHAYCYEDMVADFPEYFQQQYGQGTNPYDAVEIFADMYDLEETAR